MIRLIYLLITILYFSYHGIYGQQTSIKFDIPQAQRLWDDGSILGSSTQFGHPVTLGTFTECDKLEISKVFTPDYKFQKSYDENQVNRIHYRSPGVRVVTGVSYRKAKAIRTIETKILSAKGCVLACITEKDFVCRDCDYFKGDGGKCALYNTTGPVLQEDPEILSPYYVGDNPASDHFIIYKDNEFPIECDDLDEYTHHYFALGWKAMETGWYILAHDMFNKAISMDSNFTMAYIGKILANENMGYGLGDDVIPNYKDKIQEILITVDFRVKLSIQEQLLVEALNELHLAPNLEEGLRYMITVFSGDLDTLKDYIDSVIDGNAQLLLSSNSYQIISRLAETNVFAVQLLTHNLNPYKYGKGRITEVSGEVATKAIFDFQQLQVKGAWAIYADCADIAEYYAEWSTGRKLLSDQRDFLFRNTDNSDDSKLFEQNPDNLVVHRMNITYMSTGLQRINEYERLHFFQLQLALFRVAKQHLQDLVDDAEKDDDEQRQGLRHRMHANAYFSTYGYIYEQYAKEMVFTADWTTPATNSSNDLALISRAYYWTAAAAQRVEAGGNVDDIISALDKAMTVVTEDSDYMTLLEIYKYVVMGTVEISAGNIDEALNSANKASEMQDKLVNADFTIEGNVESTEFRMLVPLGYQFRADILRTVYNKQGADGLIKISSVIKAYTIAVTTPPLRTSRILRGYGESLETRDKDNPRKADEDTPEYVAAFEELVNKAWREPEVDGTFLAKTASDEAIEYYYAKPESGCPADKFMIRSNDKTELCWGGYIIIGVSVAVVIIIAIIVGILCLRKKAKAPQKNKEKEDAFIFSGPNLSRQESFGSSYPIGTLNRASPEPTPYASQTLSIQRPFHDDDYTQKSNTIGGVGTTDMEFEASSSH